MRGRIREAQELQGTLWRLPFTLLVWCLSRWRVIGRYPSRRLAEAAARRRGIEVRV